MCLTPAGATPTWPSRGFRAIQSEQAWDSFHKITGPPKDISPSIVPPLPLCLLTYSQTVNVVSDVLWEAWLCPLVRTWTCTQLGKQKDSFISYSITGYLAIIIRPQCGRSGFDSWVVKIPGEGNGYPLQYPSLENSTDCIVHGVAKNQAQLSNSHLLFSRVPIVSKAWCLPSEACTLVGRET